MIADLAVHRGGVARVVGGCSPGRARPPASRSSPACPVTPAGGERGPELGSADGRRSSATRACCSDASSGVPGSQARSARSSSPNAPVQTRLLEVRSPIACAGSWSCRTRSCRPSLSNMKRSQTAGRHARVSPSRAARSGPSVSDEEAQAVAELVQQHRVEVDQRAVRCCRGRGRTARPAGRSALPRLTLKRARMSAPALISRIGRRRVGRDQVDAGELVGERDVVPGVRERRVREVAVDEDRDRPSRAPPKSRRR